MTLLAVHGLTHAEVASALGVPVGTVMSRLSRARSRVRSDLAARSAAGSGCAMPAVPVPTGSVAGHR